MERGRAAAHEGFLFPDERARVSDDVGPPSFLNPVFLVPVRSNAGRHDMGWSLTLHLPNLPLSLSLSCPRSRFENFNAVSARYDGGLKALQLRRDELHQEAVAVAKLFWGDNWAAEVRPRS